MPDSRKESIVELTEKERGALAELAVLDEALRARYEVLKAVPTKLEQIERGQAEIRAKEKESEGRVKEAERRRIGLEDEIDLLNKDLDKFKVDLMKVKDNNEYKAMLDQIAHAEKKIDDLETDVLEAMERTEAMRRLHADLLEKTEKKLDELAGKRSEIESARDEAQRWVDRHARDRSGLLEKLPPMLLREYERIFARHKDVAVVVLREGVCGGCHSRIPAQVGLEIRRGIRLHRCEHCGRLLVAEADVPLDLDADLSPGDAGTAGGEL